MHLRRHSTWVLLVLVALTASASAQTPTTAPTPADAPVWPHPATAHAEPMPRATRALLLDVAAAGTRLIAVGERGHVLLSDDAGETWRQVVVPTRSTLTAVAASGQAAVAAGHDGVILHSTDAGDTWQRVREEPFSPDNVASPSNGSPLLDVIFLDEQRVLAVGGYSLVLASGDGGNSWQPTPLTLVDAATSAVVADSTTAASEPAPDAADAPADDADEGRDPMLFSEDELLLDDEVDPHLNAIVRVGPADLLLVGERGTVYRSRDDGATWQRLNLPYGGSMFGAVSLGGSRLVVFGLRGRAFESADLGDTWTELATGVQASLFAGSVAVDGTLSLVGAEGAVLQRRSGASAFSAAVHSTDSGETPIASAALAREDGSLLLLGERGVATWKPLP